MELHNSSNLSLHPSPTGTKESALLVADQTSIDMLLRWVKVVAHLLPQAELAFPDFNGDKMKHLERRICVASKSLGYSLPTATVFRKLVEIRNKRLDNSARQAVSRALSHSAQTAAQYYQAPTKGDAYSTYAIIRDIIKGDRACSPETDNMERKGKGKKWKGKEKMMLSLSSRAASPNMDVDPQEEYKGKGKGKGKWKKKEKRLREEESSEEEFWRKGKKKKVREEESSEEEEGKDEKEKKREGKRKFTVEEEEHVQEYFSENISKRKFPSMDDCRKFLKLFSIDRKPKDIYDKCRNLAGR